MSQELSREEIVGLLTSVLTAVKESQGRIWDLLRKDAFNINTLAKQVEQHARDGTAPTSEQVKEWARAMRLAAESVTEVADKHHGARIWTEGKLRTLGLSEEEIAFKSRVHPKLHRPP